MSLDFLLSLFNCKLSIINYQDVRNLSTISFCLNVTIKKILYITFETDTLR